MTWAEAEHPIRIGAGQGGADFRLMEAVLARRECTLNLPIQLVCRLSPYSFGDRTSRDYNMPLAADLRDHVTSLMSRINAGKWTADPSGHWPRPAIFERMVAALKSVNQGWELNPTLAAQISTHARVKDAQLDDRIREMLGGLNTDEFLGLAADAVEGRAPKGNAEGRLSGLFNELARKNRS